MNFSVSSGLYINIIGILQYSVRLSILNINNTLEEVIRLLLANSIMLEFLWEIFIYVKGRHMNL